MAMNAVDMKDYIISKMNREAGSAIAANKKFGDAILEYIIGNMDITYGWSARNPSSGATDPITSFTATLSGEGTLAPSGSFTIFLVNLTTLIKTSIVIMPPAGFSLAPLTYNPDGVITASMGNENSQDAGILRLCVQIIASLILSFPNPAAVSGSRGAFAGATTEMVIA